jgi:hypothetical protein
LSRPNARGRALREPANLGRGWTSFDFAAAAPTPIKLVNDAAMQALGSYDGRTMLFLGLGTGLGSALIVDGTLVQLELSRLPYRRGEMEDYVGRARAREVRQAPLAELGGGAPVRAGRGLHRATRSASGRRSRSS